MDPLSIATGCATLISTIGSLSLSINTFVRTCREARSDLDRVARELLSLQTVLDLIQEDVADESKTFPTTLERHVSGIIINCNSVVVELQEIITKYGGDSRLKSKAGWAINGQGDVSKLRSNLHVTKEIKNDTSEIRNDTSAIKDDTAQILEEILRLQQRLPKQGGNDYILQNFLEAMTTYTEKALDGASIDGGDSSTKAPSFVLETDEGSQKPSNPTHPSDWKSDSAASDLVSYKSKKKRSEEQQHEERLAEAKLKDVQRSLESTQQQPAAFNHAGHREPSEGDDELWSELPKSAYIEDFERSPVESHQEPSEEGDDPGPELPKSAYIEDFERSSVESVESETEWWEKRQKEWQALANQSSYPEVERSTTPVQSTPSQDDGQRDAGMRHPQHTRVSESDDKRSNDYGKKLSATPDNYYMEIERYYYRLLISWPMPTAITDLLSEDYAMESSWNSFTALTCTAQEFPFLKDVSQALRPMRIPRPRNIKIVFYIPVTTQTTSSCFQRQWEFINIAVAGLTWRLELGGDVPPPWHNIIIVVEGPPRWDGINPEIEVILTELGILYKSDNLVARVDGVELDPPYHKDHCNVGGQIIFWTIHEYTVPPTIRPQHACTKNIMGTEPLQVIAVAPQWSPLDWTSHKPALPLNWAAAVCEVLKPEFIVSLPEHQIRDIPSPGEFLKGVWTCQIRFRRSKSPKINQCVLTSPDQFQADRKKMITRAEGARGFARRLFGKS
ncbi:uncharacterized protein FTJAE_4759 [Fusarium tjaetaba]|uniref:Azaphilone pigments biosynthesis cluster protein L N-terminal domain-containing protein n=1 Tax=Fusarium tjaetaba TaxID=1567544 RepID=A0A8H5VVW1_9HYPO|nr:uncharacterized protein FTJAE_4759 [Fusarium tjaetaba]KAF5639422.1 hypothetical protein FTJAE_4759 [Fusarium tjaetaba]